MARRKRRRSRRQMSVPISIVGGIFGALALPDQQGNSVVKSALSGNWGDALMRFGSYASGFNAWTGKIDPTLLAKFYGPIALGALVHKFVGGSLGVNRMLAAAKIPLFRI